MQAQPQALTISTALHFDLAFKLASGRLPDSGGEQAMAALDSANGAL
ncbi:hypothetical protein CCC_01374 [Paramagnetospirillum magnetotacticum MS-1]|uniref:Uncharacterized protein n=1 Tax=Paramagnetospirillum magnetotacticum MS-1 TaxID=272627 RepID=A0A0C2UVL7_PARME|nr:hypothetical protein CCC_01374 [Paramagnetospirillum magnetotacticum MS-1]